MKKFLKKRKHYFYNYTIVKITLRDYVIFKWDSSPCVFLYLRISCVPNNDQKYVNDMEISFP